MRAAAAFALRLRARDRGPVAVVRAGDEAVVCSDPVARVTADGTEGIAALDAIWHGGGFWVGALAYDLGRAIETFDRHSNGASRARGDRDHPGVAFTRFATQVRFGPHTTTPVEQPGEEPPVEPPAPLGAMVSSMSRAEHGDAVAAIGRHLRAGDCYQVNLTRRLSTRRRADPRALFAALSAANPAPHAALVELDGTALVSASPERFLRIADGTVETRPIKGTHASADALVASVKDLAEHVMIVDMARNDLGRVCELGHVGVAELAAVERHPGLAHLVSTVRGRLRRGAGLAGVVQATFPPASITGAPKPRVIQIIDTLEPVRRGYYCGALGWIDASAQQADLAVAIRTFVVSRHGTDLGVGGGIVADSTAGGEWHESCLKAARLMQAAGAWEADAAPAAPAAPAASVDTVGASR